MSQLDEFREQLRQRPKLNEVEREKTVAEDSSAQKKVRKKKDVPKQRAAVWISKECQRKARLLALWLDAEGIEGPDTIGSIFSDALDVLIDAKYPKAKKYVERG